MRILYITTIGPTMGFFKSLIYKLIENGNTVDIAANVSESDVPDYYRKWGCSVYPLSCTRNPFARGNINAVHQIQQIVTEGKYDIVHCHTPIAAMCTRIACKSLRKKGVKVFYTAHGFHFYKGAPLKNWLLYYPVEWICAHWTDVLITINREDYFMAKKHMKAKRVEYVPGVGIDLKKFIPDKMVWEEKEKLRKSFGLGLNDKLILSAGELNANKNHEIVIRALSELHDRTVHYAIAGAGELRDYLWNLAKELGVSDQVHLLGFRNDVVKLYHVSDACVFPSIREGLGLAALEGMACGLPLICSDNRGTRDYAIDGENAFVCRCHSVDDYTVAIRLIISDDQLKKKMGELNRSKVEYFEIENVNHKMKALYEEYAE